MQVICERKGTELLPADGALRAPGDTDADFRVPEGAALAERIPGAVGRPLASPYGHRAGDPQRPGMESEREWLRAAVSRFREGD